METPIFHMGVYKKLSTKELTVWKNKQAQIQIHKKQKLHKIQKIHKINILNENFPIYKILPYKTHLCYIPDASTKIQLIIHMYGKSIKKIYNLLVCYKKMYMNKPNNSFFKQFCKTNIWEDEYKSIKEWYFTNTSRRFLLKNLLVKYLLSLSKKCVRNIDDPCTLLPPVQKITCIDINQRCYYQFEAKSIQKIFITSIGYNDWLFPEPLPLKNPLTNIPFHNGQLLSIVRQLRFFNRTTWMIESVIKFMNRQEMYKIVFDKPLQMYGIDDVIRNPTSESSVNLVQDFVENEYNYFNLYTKNRRDVITILWAIKERPNNLYIQKWFKIFKVFETYKLLKGIIPISNRLKSLELIHDTISIKELSKERLNIRSIYFPIDSVEEF